MTDAALRQDGFLGGRLQIWQPSVGYRAGADAVMLGAACPAQPGQSVLELGCGAGVALICLGARQPDLVLSGIELQADYAALAVKNAQQNEIKAEIVNADLQSMPSGLRAQSFDHVIANPPYFTAGSVAPDPGRGIARHEDAPLPVWIDAALRRLRSGGMLTMINRADRLDAILSLLQGRAGAITILPVTARQGRDAGRVIVAARKQAKGALRLLSPFVMHINLSHSDDAADLSPAAQAVLRDGAALDMGFHHLR